MSENIVYTVLNGTVPYLLRHLAAQVAGLWERRAVINQLSSMSDHELADIGLNRAGICAVLDRKVEPASNARRPVLDTVEEQVLADLGLSRRFPFAAADH